MKKFEKLQSTWLIDHGEIKKLPIHEDDENAIEIAEAIGRMAAAATNELGVEQCTELRILKVAGWQIDLEISDGGLIIYCTPPVRSPS